MPSAKEVVQCNMLRFAVSCYVYFLAEKYEVKLLRSYGKLKGSGSHTSIFCFLKCITSICKQLPHPVAPGKDAG